VKKKKLIWLGVLVFFIICIAIFYYFDVDDFFSLARLQKNSLAMLQFVQRNYLLSVGLYIALFVAMIAFSLPITGPLTVLGGFLFGFIRGTLYATVSATAGASIAFLIFRKGLTDVVNKKYGKRLERLEQSIKKYGAADLLISNFSTMVPYAVINVLAALSDIRLWTIIWTTFVGCIPISLVYTFAGSRFTNITSMSEIFSFNVIFAFILLILVMLIPLVIQRLRGGKLL